MKKFKQEQVGHYTIVRWDCVGVREGILTDVDDDKMSARWFPLCGDKSCVVSVDQVVSIGDRVQCSKA